MNPGIVGVEWKVVVIIVVAIVIVCARKIDIHAVLADILKDRRHGGESLFDVIPTNVLRIKSK
jgi:hypothetical protein